MTLRNTHLADRVRPDPWHPAAIGLLVCPLALSVLSGLLFVGGLAGWNPLWPDDRPTLSEAVALRDRGAIVQLLREGYSMDGRYLVRAGLLGPGSQDVTPLEAAVMIGDRKMLRFMLDRAGTVPLEQRLSLRCFAEHVGAIGLIPMVDPSGAPGPCD